MMPPADYSILCTQYFGSLRNANVATHWTQNITAMGLDPIKQWHELGREVVGSAGVFTIDYSGFDNSQPSQFFHLLELMCDEFYRGKDSPKARKIRRTLLREACHTIFIFRDGIFQIEHGNPSGFPAGLTTIINNMINICMYLVAWNLTTGLDFASFFFYCWLIVLGDDSLCGIRSSRAYDGLPNDFNRLALAKLADSLGMVATDAQKNAALDPFDKPGEATFLKRGFQFTTPFWCVPIIAMETIQGLIDFCSRKPGNPQILVNIHEALRFSVPHGPGFYREMTTRISEYQPQLDLLGIRAHDIWNYAEAERATFPREWFVAV
jgi:hypothetical protein